MGKYWENGNLRISENGRYFLNGDTPFFLLADTAWTLFQKLYKDEATIYLRNRKDKNFNTIFSVLINFQSRNNSAFDLKDGKSISDIISDDDYWNHITKIVTMAEDLGLYMGLLPVWGNVVMNKHLRVDNMDEYISFIADKFEHFKNIIWIVGGDCRGDFEHNVWQLMGKLLKQKMPNRLVGYHPFGRTSSSYWFQDADWLDFHMFQSGHRRTNQRNLNAWDEIAAKEPWHGEESFRYVYADYEKTPPRPILDGEPSYEQILQGLHNPDEPYWQDHHVRRYAYWSTFAGAAGHVYGHNSIIQFYGTGGSAQYGVKEEWDKSIHDIGSSQMQFLKVLLENSDFQNCIPMQHILTDPAGLTQEDNILALGNDRVVLCYSYSGRAISFNDSINGSYNAYWFDPISGSYSYIGEFNVENATLTPPDKKNGWNDWVLVLHS
jgi:hypothetical protein